MLAALRALFHDGVKLVVSVESTVTEMLQGFGEPEREIEIDRGNPATRGDGCRLM